MEPRSRRVQLHAPQADAERSSQPAVGSTVNPTQQEIAMNTFISLASTLVLGLAVSAAYADEAPKSLTVQFADLDLTNDAGAATLFNRIKGAAIKVCSAHSGGKTLRDKRQHAACVEFALLNAVARVDRPELTEYVTSRYSIEKQAPVKVASDR